MELWQALDNTTKLVLIATTLVTIIGVSAFVGFMVKMSKKKK